MSIFSVEVVQIKEISPHPNADRLGLVEIGKFPVVVNLEEFEAGDLAAYIPADTIVGEQPEFEFLGPEPRHRRIRARKFRGLYSEGLLIKARPDWKLGQNVAKELGCEKWEEQISGDGIKHGLSEHNPPWFHFYTEIELYRKFPNIFQGGESVVCTEKLHGTNLRVCFQDGRLWVGSHHLCKLRDEQTLWWKAVVQNGIEEKARALGDLILYGEVYGCVQDLRYGAKPGELFIAFYDAYSERLGTFVDWDQFVHLAQSVDLPIVPEIHRGPWDPSLIGLAEGPTTLKHCEGAHMREGIVIKPLHERYDPIIRRVILKVISQSYMLRKSGTEAH